MIEAVELFTEVMENLPDDFKMTELGPLPNDWHIAKLGDFANIRYGKSKPPKAGGVPVIGSGGIYSWTEEPLVSYPTLVIGRKGTAGMVWYMEEPCWPSDTTFFLEWKSHSLDRRYLFYRLIYRPLSGEHAKTTLPSLTRYDLENYLVPIPPLVEQRGIAYVLHVIELTKRATEKVIAAARELKKSLMQYFFTYGPVPVEDAERVPLKETEIGPMPEHWQIARVADLFNIQQGKAVSPKHRKGQRAMPFLRTANVHWCRIDVSLLDYMDFDEDEIERLALRHGDLLVCEGGDIGRTAMWEGQLPLCLYQNHLHRLRAKRSDVEPAFFMYWMQTAWTLLKVYSGTGNKTTIPNLSRSRLASFAVPFPPLHEQREIARILHAVDQKIAAEEQRKSALDVLFKTLLHLLMTGRIRVKDLPLPEAEGVSLSASRE